MPNAEPGNLTLAIEMSNPSHWPDDSQSGEVAIGWLDENGVRLFGVEPITADSPRDDALASTIDRLLKQTSTAPSTLDRIAVSGGPGGFTSVRIAVTTAKAIAEAIGAPVVVVPTDESIARAIRKDRGDLGVIAVTLAGKRDSAWCAVTAPCAWDTGSWPIPIASGVMTAASISESGWADSIEAMITDSHIPGSFLDWATDHSVEVVAPKPSAESVLVASRFHEAVDPVLALPIYPREPEAVTVWRDRHGSGKA